MEVKLAYFFLSTALSETPSKFSLSFRFGGDCLLAAGGDPGGDVDGGGNGDDESDCFLAAGGDCFLAAGGDPGGVCFLIFGPVRECFLIFGEGGGNGDDGSDDGGDGVPGGP